MQRVFPQGDVILLGLAFREICDGAENGFLKFLQRFPTAMLQDDIDEPLYAKLFAGTIAGFVDAVGV